MVEAPYVCSCGSKTFIKYIGDPSIYCKACGKQAPDNVKFKDQPGLLQQLGKGNK
jgi:hypothetical protein